MTIGKESDIIMLGWIKKVIDHIIFALGGKGKVTDEAVDNGLCDFGGEGRNKYGK